MKKFISIFILSIFIFSCKKNKSEISIQKNNYENIETKEESFNSRMDNEEDIIEEEKPLPKIKKVDYVIVNSPEGIKVRESPGLSSNKITGLPDKTVVKLINKGPEETIDGICSQWLNVELPNSIAEKDNIKTGWVFGGYMNIYSDDLIASEYYNNEIKSQTGIATIGSYIKPKEYKHFVMYSAMSEKSNQISTFQDNDNGIILRVCPDSTKNDEYWYYILNESKGIRGWICSNKGFYSTADGFKVSSSKQFYKRINADVLVKTNPHVNKLPYHTTFTLCSDNIHFFAQDNTSKNLVIYNIKNDKIKEISFAEYTFNSRDREEENAVYSAKSNVVYFGWKDKIFSYSFDEDKIDIVFQINTSLFGASTNDVSINKINVSKDERYFYILAEFRSSSYVNRMIAYDSKTKVQAILDDDSNYPNSIYTSYFEHVYFDENNNAIYSATFSRYKNAYSDIPIKDNAIITVSSDSENWPVPVIHKIPENQYPMQTIYLPDSNNILCCDTRFCIYNIDDFNQTSEAQFVESYRLAENSIYTEPLSFNNFQFNDDKSICAILHDKYITFYSTKTFNLLFAFKVESESDNNINFWWNGHFLLIQDYKDENFIYSTYEISIAEKENQISDNEPLSKEIVSLCAKEFIYHDDTEIGYKFEFSPNGTYFVSNYSTYDEDDSWVLGNIGGYEIIGKDLVHLYPSFSNISNYQSNERKDFSIFSRYNILSYQNGIDLKIDQRCPLNDKFGLIYLYDLNNFTIGSTYDYGISYARYGVQFEEAATSFQIYSK